MENIKAIIEEAGGTLDAVSYTHLEDAQSGNGKAMPEFPGYCGPSDPQTPVMRVTAVTHRLHPIMQTTIGPSEEHVNLAGIPTEASILGLVERAMPCLLYTSNRGAILAKQRLCLRKIEPLFIPNKG